MTTDLRAVVDANVAVSAVLLPTSVPRRAMDLAMKIGVLLLSEATFVELHDVLRRQKHDRYVSARDRLEFLVTLVARAEVVEITASVAECRDPKDDKYLELAVSGQASHLITGDGDLLAMHPFRGISVLTPAAFLAERAQSAGDD